MPTALVIAAAGAGTRLGAGVPKALVPLEDGRPLLAHALDAVASARRDGARVDALVVLAPPTDEAVARVREVLGSHSLTSTPPKLSVRIVAGGAERADSVRAGLAAADAALTELGHSSAAGPRHVLIHDAARPFTPPAVFRAVQVALEAGAPGAVPGVPVTDTVKVVTGAQERPVVESTPARASLRAVQTPQGFDLDVLLAAHETARAAADHGVLARHGDTAGSAASAALTDDAMLLESAGHEVVVVPGASEAFKVTGPEDLAAAARLLAARGETGPTSGGLAPVPDAAPAPAPAAAPALPPLPRTGIGTDVHQWAPEDSPRPLWLGCIEWPGQRGVAATSNGDVAAHAACNALLSASGLGDLGAVFGVDRYEMKDATGSEMLAHVAGLLAAAGFRIGSVAVQIVTPRPKVGTRRAEMEAAMSAALGGVPVAVSAATTDQLGFIGRGEGLAGLATALVMPAA